MGLLSRPIAAMLMAAVVCLFGLQQTACAFEHTAQPSPSVHEHDETGAAPHSHSAQHEGADDGDSCCSQIQIESSAPASAPLAIYVLAAPIRIAVAPASSGSSLGARRVFAPRIDDSPPLTLRV